VLENYMPILVVEQILSGYKSNLIVAGETAAGFEQFFLNIPG